LKERLFTLASDFFAHPGALVPEACEGSEATNSASARGLGPINTTQDRAVGLILHDTLAYTVEGTPLGLLDVQCWARDPEESSMPACRRSGG